MKKPKTQRKKKQTKLLSPLLEKMYKQRKAKVKSVGQLERRIKKLKEERDQLDGALIPIFEENSNKCQLANGTIVELEIKEIGERVALKKGQIIQSGYSYPQYHEIAGE